VTVTVYKQGATGQTADKAQKGANLKSHRRALTVRGAEPRERIDVDQIIQLHHCKHAESNPGRCTHRRYGSDPIRKELNPVRSMHAR
jgi:hypothetical protein